MAARLQACSLSNLKQKRIREKKEKERVREISWTWGLFFRTHKNARNLTKIDLGLFEEVKSTPVGFNSDKFEFRNPFE